MHLNFQRKDENGNLDENWNKAVANRAFRQCFYKGINFTNYYARTNKINPLKCENDYYTMPGVCYNTKGEEYTTLVAKEMGFDGQAYDGKTMIRLRDNGGDIADLKKQAMEELSAIGVTFPVKATYFIIASSTSALDNATILKQCFSDSFGDDFIKLDVQTYVSSLTQEVRTPQLQSFVINGWSADFGDPVNFLGQETLHDDNAFYSHYYSNIARVAEAPADYQKDLMDAFEQYTDLVNAANAIVNDTDARYEAFAKAEAYLLENVLVSPAYYDITWSLTHANEYSKIYAMYGGCNYKAVNWETSEEAYTTVQYEQGEEGSFYFYEEAVWPEYSPKQINVTDRATILNFIIGLNGYTVCTGIDNGDLNNEKIVTVPLDTDETMLVGWITNERSKLSKAAETYLTKLKSVVADHGYKLID